MRFSFAPLALIVTFVPGGFSQNTTSDSAPRNSEIPIPKTWDECIGAGIAEIWEAHKARDTAIGAMSPDIACSAKPMPCILDLCKSNPGVRTALEGYVTIFCGNKSLDTVESNCWQFADHDAIAAGFKVQAPVRAIGLVGAVVVALAIGSV